MRLIATKANKYGTRHLEAGDEFEMADRYARTPTPKPAPLPNGGTSGVRALLTGRKR